MKSSARLSSSALSPTSRAGFTLLELLVTIALIGILSALAVPGLNGIYQRQNLSNAAEEVVSTIKLAQNAAISNNQGANPTGQGTALTNDCTATKAYVTSFEFRVVDTHSYRVNKTFKSTNAAGQPCPVPTGDATVHRGTFTLPSAVEFASSDPSTVVAYDTVTGKISPSSLVEYQLTHSKIPSLTYHICVTQGRAYAQTESC